MPSSIFFQGQRIYRPGTYVRVNDTLSAISDLTGGNIALVGDFSIFPQAEIQTFSSFDNFMEAVKLDGSIAEYDGIDYQAIGNLAFKALLGATQQIDSLSIINTRGVTQAAFESNGLKVKSKLYGAVGTQVVVTLQPSSSRPINPGAADQFDIFIHKSGTQVEEMLDIGDGAAALLKYTYTADPVADADGEFDYGIVEAQVTATHIEITAKKPITNVAINLAANQNAAGLYELDFNKSVEGTISITPVDNQTAQDNTLFITGFGSDGVFRERYEVIMHDGAGEAGVTFTSDISFNTISKIEISAATDGDVVLKWHPKKTAFADVGDLEGWLNDLQRRNSDFRFTAPSTVITGDELDRDSAVFQIQGGTDYTFTTDLHRIAERAFNASKWVEAEKLSNEPPELFEQRTLQGGDKEASTPISAVQDALDSILYKNINIVVPASDDIEVHKLVKQHCTDASDKAGLERNCWLGTEADRTLDYVHNIYVKELNDRNCAVVCQGIKLAKTGQSFITPWYTALGLASVQAATPIAEPMTRKRLQGVEPIQTTFDPDADANKAIRLSIVVINSPIVNRIRVERSVTTYRRNLSHPVFCEVSANESINTCIRTLRAKLDAFIGSKATPGQANSIKRSAERHLAELQALEIIAGFKDVSVRLDGDKLNVVFDVAAIEPLNFITVQANLGQF